MELDESMKKALGQISLQLQKRGITSANKCPMYFYSPYCYTTHALLFTHKHILHPNLFPDLVFINSNLRLQREVKHSYFLLLLGESSK